MEVEPLDLHGIFHVFLVFTSAFFAVSQYYENRQARLILDGQKELEKVDFTLASTNNGMRDVKKNWDDIQVVKPLNNSIIITTLFILLVLYVFLFAISMCGEWSPNINALTCGIVINVLRLLSIFLFGIGGYLFFNWREMKKQLKNFYEKIDTFNLLYETVAKAIPSPATTSNRTPTRKH